MKAKEKAALAKVAKEFEGVLLKQILEASKPLGHSGGGYAAMAVDALASGIQAGGGIGLADTIERALSAQHAGPKGGPQK
jgi:Rod binding domain-containing protein